MARRGRKETDKQGNIYFVTTTIVSFARILTLNECFPQTIIDSLKYLVREHRAFLIAYVVMPSHIHFIVEMPEGESISDFMRDFKKYTSKEIYRLVVANGHEELAQRFRENSDTGGIKVWMDRFDSKIIETEKFLLQKINYIHDNPVRAGLADEVTDWLYSSARDYYSGGKSATEDFDDKEID